MENNKQYHGILCEAVKTYAGTLVDLYKSGCTDIEVYKETAELVPVGILPPNLPQNEDYHLEIMKKQLQSEMNDTRILVTQYKDTAYTRAKAGIAYIQSMLYQKIKQSGLGTLIRFSFKGGQLYVKISFRLKIPPVLFETAEEKEQRMEKAAEESGFIWHKSKTYNCMFMKTCSSNMKKLKQWLDSMFCYHGVCLNIRGNNIWDISFYIKSLYDFKAENEHGNEYKINEIVKTAIGMMQDINTATAYGIHEVTDVLYPKLAGDCFYICTQADSDCDFVQQYKKNILPLRDENADTQEKMQKIGKDVPFDEIKKTASSISTSVHEKMEEWYGAYTELKIDAHGLSGTLYLNSISMQLDETDNFKTEFKLAKLVMENLFGDYYIPSYNIDEIRSIMIQDGLDIRSIKIDYKDGYSCIQEIEFYIHDLWSKKWAEMPSDCKA